MPKLVITMRGGDIVDFVTDEAMDIAIIDYEGDDYESSLWFRVENEDAIGYMETTKPQKEDTEYLFDVLRQSKELNGA